MDETLRRIPVLEQAFDIDDTADCGDDNDGDDDNGYSIDWAFFLKRVLRDIFIMLCHWPQYIHLQDYPLFLALSLAQEQCPLWLPAMLPPHPNIRPVLREQLCDPGSYLILPWRGWARGAGRRT